MTCLISPPPRRDPNGILFNKSARRSYKGSWPVQAFQSDYHHLTVIMTIINLKIISLSHRSPASDRTMALAQVPPASNSTCPPKYRRLEFLNHQF